jgi:hypothetical protein
MQHFLNPSTIASGQICCRDVSIHCHSRAALGCFIFLVGVRIWSPAENHSEYSCFKWSLKGVFTKTSRTCSWEVIPQYMNTRSLHESADLTSGVKWHLNASSTSIPHFVNNPCGLLFQTTCDQSLNS